MKVLTAGDGYALHYRVWEPASAPRGTIVLLNGVMSHSGWFEPLSEPLTSAGFKLVGADRRGSGMNDASRGDAPSAGVIIADIKSIISAERVGALYLAGWCWGGVLAVNLAVELEKELAGLILLAPGLFPTSALKTAMAEEVARRAADPEDSACLVSPIVEEMFTAGPALESFIRGDSLRLKSFTPRFHQASLKLTMNAIMRLKTLKLPLLLLLASDDEATDNTETLRAFSKVPQAIVETLESKHGMQFDQPAALAASIVRFASR